ncbi:MAG: hypothetical protein ABUK01_13825 [Leptospirales bacterium]
MILSFLAFFKPAHGALLLDLVDTPTAFTMYRGEFNIGIWGYDNGGILTRATIGLHDNIFLGVAFDIENLIGDDEVQFNIPGVLARIKITDGWDTFPLLVAVGYDAFYDALSQRANLPPNVNSRLIYGPYLVITKPIYLFNQEQHFHFGVRLPVQPTFEPEDTSLFVGIDIPIGPFVPMFEVERVFFDANRLSETLFNIGFRYHLYENFALELNFILNANAPASRILTFDYVGTF